MSKSISSDWHERSRNVQVKNLGEILLSCPDDQGGKTVATSTICRGDDGFMWFEARSVLDGSRWKVRFKIEEI